MPCFTPGIVTVTEAGERAVEELSVGDRVITRDNGFREIRWIGRRTLQFGELQANPHLKPILFRVGSIGPGLPESDMLLSPNHRLLTTRDRSALHFDRAEALIAAKHLVGAEGIRAVDVLGVTYLHMQFDRHEIILANGAWTEAFHTDDASLGAQGNAQRNEIHEVFPDLRSDSPGRIAAGKERARQESVLLEFSR